MAKKIKQKWIVPDGIAPTEMDLKIMEFEARGKMVPTRSLIKTKEQIEGIRKAGVLNTAVLDTVAEKIRAGMSTLDIDKIEYAAEIAIEHHLGLTCDPICGLVQIPCIERNAVAAMRAINAVSLASFLWDSRKISLDKVIQTMKETGRDISSSYKETSEAGLAKIEL